jgi:hypothetical protein
MNLDALIIALDNGLRTVFTSAHSVRPLPGKDLPDADLNEARKEACGEPDAY